MKSSKYLPLFVALVLALAVGTGVVFAVSPKIMRASVIDADAETEIEKVSKDECVYDTPEEAVYDAELVTVRKKLRVDIREVFRVKVFMKNTGNFTWFSESSGCDGHKISLGTDLERDHESVFYSPYINKIDNNWESENRVGMDQDRVDPGEIASFTFWVEAGRQADVYKEFMTPVIDNEIWLDDAGFSFTVMVGETGEDKTSLRKKMLFAAHSGSVSSINLDGDKKILVDISDQKAKLMLDDYIVREFLVSTGAYSTPTPRGEFEISLKQEVRVGGAAPHYIMPNFMLFRSGGYGLHALPSLRTDGGAFWTEAREHIGIPVSHGCIRMLPEDAEFAFEFADLGTAVVIQG